jgi:DNA-binding beta-propeller fold protein YncE
MGLDQRVIRRAQRAKDPSLRSALPALCFLFIFFCCFLLVPEKLYAGDPGKVPAFTESIYFDDEGDRLSYPFFVFAEPVMKELYVIDSGQRIIIYNEDLFPLYTLSGKNGIGAPQGLTVDREGNVFICTRKNLKHMISVFNASLKLERDIFLSGFDGAESFNPYRIALDREGNMYVAGYYDPRIPVLDRQGKLIDVMTFDEEVKFNDITIDNTGNIYLTSEESGKIYIFDEKRKFLFNFGERGGVSGTLSRPQNVGIDNQNGMIYVVDYLRHTINIYDKKGTFIADFGGMGIGDGWFQHPNDIAVDNKGRIFVSDLFNNRVQVFQAKE